MKLLFDCDGTILDSMHFWLNPINEIFAKYGLSLDEISPEEKGKIEALSIDGMCEYIASNLAHDMTKQEVKEYFNETIEEGYANFLMPKNGTLEILEKLHEKGYEMAIASSTDSKYLKIAFKRLNIDHYFSFIASPDTTKSKKSDLKFWQYALDKLNAKAEDVILYDDALYAIKAAKQIGIITCGLKDFPHNEKEWDEIKSQATMTLDGIWDIDIDSLEKWSSKF